MNDLSTGLVDDDLAGVVGAAPDGIMLPKSNSGADVQHLAVKLRVHEAENGLADGGIRIIPIITETGAGVFSGASYRGIGERLAGLTWGAEDLSAAIGAARHEGRRRQVHRRLSSRACRHDPGGRRRRRRRNRHGLREFSRFRRRCRAECLEAERDGFTAKMAIHPAQVPVINEAFTPSREAIERATAIVAAFAADGNPGVVGIDGQMYDRPHLKRAERLLQRARAAGLI